jgi:exodeoxyribonuclease V alpha subunit
VLAELIRSGVVPVVALRDVFRQAAESGIVVNAHRVNRGERLTLAGDEGGDFFFVEREAPEDILATVKSVVAERIPRRFGLDPMADVQVLTPMHRGLLGSRHLNQELQALLNPRPPLVEHGARAFRLGDRVMQLKNDYTRDLANGDLGRVVGFDEETAVLRVRFDEREVAYEAAELDALALAYASSIHKAQGSEYPCVVLALHTQHWLLLQRNLLYTAITRGRRLVVIVGSARALALAVRTARSDRRRTRLAARLAAAAGGDVAGE